MNSKEAKQQQKLSLLGSLTAGVVHDLNNVFAGILSYTDLLSMQVEHPIQQEYLESLTITLNQGKNLTNKLLNFLFDQNEETNTTSLDVLRDLGKLQKKSLRNNIIFNQTLPDSHFPVGIAPSDLAQIFLNLVMNAQDAIDGKGEISVKGHFLPIKRKLYFLLEVRDSGCGIPSHMNKVIFKPFFSSKKSKKGTGLGLSIVQDLVHQSGGFIQVESVPSVFSAFKVFIPTVSNTLAKPCSKKQDN